MLPTEQKHHDKFWCRRCKKFHREGSDKYYDHKAYIKARNRKLGEW